MAAELSAGRCQRAGVSAVEVAEAGAEVGAHFKRVHVAQAGDLVVGATAVEGEGDPLPLDVRQAPCLGQAIEQGDHA